MNFIVWTFSFNKSDFEVLNAYIQKESSSRIFVFVCSGGTVVYSVYLKTKWRSLLENSWTADLNKNKNDNIV